MKFLFISSLSKQRIPNSRYGLLFLIPLDLDTFPVNVTESGTLNVGNMEGVTDKLSDTDTDSEPENEADADSVTETDSVVVLVTV